MAVPFFFLSALLAVGTPAPVMWSWGGPQAAALQREAVDVDMALAEAQQTPGYGGAPWPVESPVYEGSEIPQTSTVTQYAIATSVPGQATIVVGPSVTSPYLLMPGSASTVPLSIRPLGEETQAPMSSASPSPASASPAGASTSMPTPSQSPTYTSSKHSPTVATITATGTVQATATATIGA